MLLTHVWFACLMIMFISR